MDGIGTLPGRRHGLPSYSQMSARVNFCDFCVSFGWDKELPDGEHGLDARAKERERKTLPSSASPMASLR